MSMTKKKELLLALLGGGALIAAALILKYLASLGYLESESSRRGMQAVIGAYLVYMGNLIPKKLTLLSDKSCGLAKGRSLRRFAGWAFVLAGLSYSILWLFAPVEVASLWGKIVVGTSVALVAAPCAWLFFRRKRAQAHSEI